MNKDRNELPATQGDIDELSKSFINLTELVTRQAALVTKLIDDIITLSGGVSTLAKIVDGLSNQVLNGQARKGNLHD